MRIGRALSLRMARRFLRGGAGRLVLTVVALTCGVALVCAMSLVSRAVARAFVEVVDTMAGRAALTVTAMGVPFPERTAEQVAGVAGVELAVPVVSATAFPADGSGELLTVHGVDVTDEAAVRVYEARDAGGLELDDPLVFLNQPDSIVVTRSFAARRGLGIDDRLELLTPTGRHAFTVRGLLEPRGVALAYGGNLVVMDLPAAEAAFVRPGMVNRIDVVVARDARVSEVQAAIARMLPQGFRVEAPSQRQADLHRVMGSLQVMLDALSLIGLAAAGLIMLNRLTTVFETRAWQLGILRAVGMRSTTVWWELLKESLLLGGVGVALGIPAGVVAGRFLVPIVATTAALNFKLIATDAALEVGLGPLLTAAALGLGTAVLAAALPAWRIARRPPIETIRGRGLSPNARIGRVGWSARGSVAAAIALALAAQSAAHTPTWGLVATGLIIVAAALAARPLLQLAAPALVAALWWIAGPSAWLARGAFIRNSGRAVLTTAMLGVGIGAIIWLRMLGYSFETTLVEALSGAMQGDWVVSSAHSAQGFLEAPLDDRLIDELRQIDGVGGSVGERLVDWEYGGGPVAIDAFDARYFATPAFGRFPLIGAAQPNVWEAVSAGTAVLVSGSLGVEVGDRMQLRTPGGTQSLDVAGITIDFGSPRGTIVMSRDLYRAAWNDPQVNRVFVRVAPGADPGRVRNAIAATLGTAYGLRIMSVRSLMDYFTAQVQRAFAPLDVLAALLLLVLLIGLADTLAASVLERTQELAVTRTLGARRAVLGRAVVTEAVGLGLLGLLVAVAVGLGLGTLWVRQTFPFLLGWPLRTYVPYTQVALVCAATLVVCAVAALLPARRAAGLEAAAALRCE